jgi:hypothetical protein
MSNHKGRWAAKPGEKDLLAALSYLSLLLPTPKAKDVMRKARRTPVSQHVAKDLLRASNLPLLESDEAHVAADLKRIRKGKALAPIILVQGDLTRGRPFIIADGYHRLCAACHADEDLPVHAVLASL